MRLLLVRKTGWTFRPVYKDKGTVVLCRLCGQWLTSGTLRHYRTPWAHRATCVDRRRQGLTQTTLWRSPDLWTSLVRLRGLAQSGLHWILCHFVVFLRLILEKDHVVCHRTTAAMSAETADGSSPSHVWTRTFQCSSTNFGSRGQPCHWTHASGDAWGSSKDKYWHCKCCKGRS